MIILNATDDGSHDIGYGPQNAIDGDLEDESRWSSEGDGKIIAFDLGVESVVTDIRTAWYRANERTARYELEGSVDGQNWALIASDLESQGSTQLESQIVDESTVEFVRIIGRGNDSNAWNSLLEIEIHGCNNGPVPSPSPEPTPPPGPDLAQGQIDYASLCAGCHGADGNGRIPITPFEGMIAYIASAMPQANPDDCDLDCATNVDAYIRNGYSLEPQPTPTPEPTPEPTPTAEPTPTPPPSGELDPNAPPSSNFDLSAWYVSVPTDDDNSGTADSIYENSLNNGYEDNRFFYTGDDGGMVFVCPIDGFRTSENTSYTRVELREMLRRGDTSISTKGVNGNNWVFSSAPESARDAAGGVDGVLQATLAVNAVTSTGSSGQVGRVIIGQIHANDDEPARLYYRLLPGHTRGSIYLAHEPIGEDDLYYEIIGSRSSSADEPSDGIALDEKFSYEIRVEGNLMTVSIMREGRDTEFVEVDMTDSGYDVDDQYMYFKAGVYNQNNTGDDDDFVQATFYSLEATHD